MADIPEKTKTLRRSVFGVSIALGRRSLGLLLSLLSFIDGGFTFVIAGKFLAILVGFSGLGFEPFDDGGGCSFCSLINSFSLWPGLGVSH